MEAVLLAALTAYARTIDLIISIRADMPEEVRRKEWERHAKWMDRLDAWIDDLFKLFPRQNTPTRKPPDA